MRKINWKKRIEKKEKNIQNNFLLFKQVIFCLGSPPGFKERKDAPFKTLCLAEVSLIFRKRFSSVFPLLIQQQVFGFRYRLRKPILFPFLIIETVNTKVLRFLPFITLNEFSFSDEKNLGEFFERSVARRCSLILVLLNGCFFQFREFSKSTAIVLKVWYPIQFLVRKHSSIKPRTGLMSCIFLFVAKSHFGVKP